MILNCKTRRGSAGLWLVFVFGCAWIPASRSTFAEEPKQSIEEIQTAIAAAKGEELTRLELLVLTRFDFSPDFRIQSAEALIKRHEGTNNSLVLGKAFAGKGTGLLHQGKLDAAIEQLKIAAEFGSQCEQQDPSVYFKALCNQAAALTILGRDKEASTLLQVALAFAKPYRDQLDVPFVYSLLAHHAEKAGAIDLALRYLQTAFEDATRTDKGLLAAQAGSSIVGMLSVNQHYKEANDWIPKVEPYLVGLSDPSVRLSFSMYREDIRSALGDSVTAATNLKRLAAEAEPTKNPQIIGNIFLSLAAAENACRRYEAAIEAADKAMALSASNPRSYMVAKHHRLSALFALERNEEALAGTQEIIDSDDQSYPRWKALELRSKILHHMGRVDEAFEVLQKARDEERTRITERANEQASFMSAVFDDQQRSNELELAKTQLQSAETQAKLNEQLVARQTQVAAFERTLRNVVIGASLLTLFLGVVFFRSLANRRTALAIAEREHQLNLELNAHLNRQSEELQSVLAARRQLEIAVERKHRDETIGKLTGGVAHDFNNLLTVIVQSIELVKMHAGSLDAKVIRLLDSSLKAADSGAGIVRQLLAYARQQPLASKPIKIGPWMASSKSMFQQMAGKQIIVRETPAAQGATVFADSARLTTAIINLLANARDAVNPLDSHIELRVSAIQLDDSSVKEWTDAVPGDYVLFEVQDNGKGMTSEQLTHACEPFFSTKSPSAGTGLGLSSVVGFVKQSLGDWQLLSEQEKGTTARFILPVLPEQATAPNETDCASADGLAEPSLNPSTTTTAHSLAEAGSFAAISAIESGTQKRQRILLVEDQDDVRCVVKISLQSMGMEVIEAANADEAKVLLSKIEQPNWVLSDVRMPGSMNGIELRRWIMNHFLNLPVILMSGYRDAATELEADAVYLNKPIKPLELRRAFEKRQVGR